MQRGALLDNSEATAKEMLQGVLNRHVSQHFLLLGDNAKRFVGDMSWQNGRLHPMIVGTGIVGTGIVGAGEAIVTHSTQEMLSDSALKSAVWTDLQPLKDKLVGP